MTTAPGRTPKLTGLADAARLVPDGARLALGGFGVYERPMAMARELVRRGARDLTVVGHVNGIETDLLAAGGCLRSVETSYVGLERYGLAPNFTRAVDAGEVGFLPFTELVGFDRFRASQSGMTFWPSNSFAGTDLVDGNPHVVEQTCPFTGNRYFAVRAADPDVVVLHAGRGDRWGNVALPADRQASHSLDVILSQSCRTVVVTVEELVEPEELRRQPGLVEIPAFQVTAIVHAPWGAHPTSVLGHYPADDAAFVDYLARSAPGGAGAASTCAGTEEQYRRDRPDAGWVAQLQGGRR